MGSIGPSEVLVVLVVALLVLGPKRLPEAARQIGRAVSEIRRVSAGFQAEIRDALNEPQAYTPPVPPPAAPDHPVVVEDDGGTDRPTAG